jgi:hypothetical protein
MCLQETSLPLTQRHKSCTRRLSAFSLGHMLAQHGPPLAAPATAITGAPQCQAALEPRRCRPAPRRRRWPPRPVFGWHLTPSYTRGCWRGRRRACHTNCRPYSASTDKGKARLQITMINHHHTGGEPADRRGPATSTHQAACHGCCCAGGPAPTRPVPGRCPWYCALTDPLSKRGVAGGRAGPPGSSTLRRRPTHQIHGEWVMQCSHLLAVFVCLDSEFLPAWHTIPATHTFHGQAHGGSR